MRAYIHTYTPPSGLILCQNESQDPGKHCPDIHCCTVVKGIQIRTSQRKRHPGWGLGGSQMWSFDSSPWGIRTHHPPGTLLWNNAHDVMETREAHTTLECHAQAASMDQTMTDWITGDGALLLAPLSSLQWYQEAKSLKPEGRVGTSEFAASWSEGRVALGTPKP